MALFTRLEPERAAAVAARYGLGAVARAEALAAGTINSNFRLETERGVVFLRVNEGKAAADVAYEAALVGFLAASGVATPRPLVTIDGAPFAEVDGLLVTVFPWVAGRHHDPPAPADCAAVGRALARLHEVGRAHPDRPESRYSHRHLLARAHALAAAPAAVAPAVRDVTAELEALAAHVPPDEGVIHGDLFPDNVLFGPDGAVLLDFEQASGGSFAYDLAVVLLSWCWAADRFVPELCRALVGAYGPVDETALYQAARLAAARFTLTRLTDVELDPRVPPEMRALKDYRAFWARLGALRALGPAGFATLTAPGR